MARHRDTLARVQPLIERISPVWEERMLLTPHTIEHRYLDTFREDDDGSSGFHTTAVTESRWQYFQARIKWYLPQCAQLSDADLEATLVHELCHVGLASEQVLIDSRLAIDNEHNGLTTVEQNALSERFYEHLEHATEWAARAFYRAYPSAL